MSFPGTGGPSAFTLALSSARVARTFTVPWVAPEADAPKAMGPLGPGGAAMEEEGRNDGEGGAPSGRFAEGVVRPQPALRTTTANAKCGMRCTLDSITRCVSSTRASFSKRPISASNRLGPPPKGAGLNWSTRQGIRCPDHLIAVTNIFMTAGSLNTSTRWQNAQLKTRPPPGRLCTQAIGRSDTGPP